MCNKEELYEKVYNPLKDLKADFYASKTVDDWNACKERLIELLTTAESLMDKDWYDKWKQGQLDSIKKMWDSKQKWFAKQQNGEKKVYTPKKSYLLQDELAEALTEYIKLQTKLLTIQYENIFNQTPKN